MKNIRLMILTTMDSYAMISVKFGNPLKSSCEF
jgi:hypothetical protein